MSPLDGVIVALATKPISVTMIRGVGDTSTHRLPFTLP